DDAPGQLTQRPQRGGAADAVRAQAVVALESTQCALGVPAEDAVPTRHVIAHLEQLLLEGHHVVTGERAGGVVRQDAVAEAPPRAGQRRPGLTAHNAVDRQASALLEMPYG